MLVKGTWIPYARRSTVISPADVEEIRFADDGRGYCCDILEVFHSSKGDDTKSVGQFGEGVKMLSAACLREGIDLELRSRDWSAVPTIRKFIADKQRIQQLQYQIFKHDDTIKGSTTTFRRKQGDASGFNALVNYVLGLSEKVLGLTGPYAALFKTEHGEILDESGRLYVKGVYITHQFKDRLLFGYNIAAQTNRDRNIVSEHELNNHIRKVISETTDLNIVRRIIESGQDKRTYLEHRALWYEYQGNSNCATVSSIVRAPDLWKETFYVLFGEKAVLPSHKYGVANDTNNFAQVMGYKVVSLNTNLEEVLERCGVKRADTIEADEYQELLSQEKYNPETLRKRAVQTSVTLAYRAGKWTALRIVLDGLANHMPTDSGGSKVGIQYLVPSGDSGIPPRWVSAEEKSASEKALAVSFKDDGRGYTPEALELLHSSKPSGASVGQFGEGLKLYSAAVLRAKEEHPTLDLKLRSRDWAAMPFATTVSVDGRAVKRLSYRIVQGLDPLKNGRAEIGIERGSTTTIYNPTADMLFVLNNLPHYVLAFNPEYNARYANKTGTIFDGTKYGLGHFIGHGTIFVKGFFMTERLANNLLFSYDLETREINPDRDIADPAVVRSAVNEIIRTCDNIQTIEEIVKAAKGNHNDIFEFQTIEFTQDNKQIAPLYKKAFHKVYGEKAVLLTNPMLALEAVHQGYTPIEVSESLRKTLRAAGVLTEKEVISEGFIPEVIAYSSLTEAEKRMLEQYKAVNAVLGLKDTGRPEVYSKLRRKDGVELPFLGFCELESGTVYLSRRALQDVNTFVNVYKHEKGHQETRAGDPTDEFRQFFEFGLDRYVVAEMKGTPRVATTYEARREESIHADRVRELEHQNISLQTRLQQAASDRTKLTELEESNVALGTELGKYKAEVETYQRVASLAATKKEEEAEFAALQAQIAGPKNPILRFFYFLLH